MSYRSIVAAALLTGLSIATHADPDCRGPDQWPAAMALVQLKNTGVAKNIAPVQSNVERLASEKISDDLYIQIHRITFTDNTGKTIQVITKSQTSTDECSMSDVEVFVIDRKLGESTISRPK